MRGFWSVPPSSAAPLGAVRDHRIDVIRGLALVMIFVNHVPGTIFERLTSRNFGFSDAAEAFVLLAGVSAALAYGRGLAAPRLWPAVARIWRRAWTLYLVHLMVSLIALAIVASMARWGGSARMILMDNFAPVLRDPIGVFIGLPTMLHQFGYINILPLYVVLLLLTPAALWLGLRKPFVLLALSVGLWIFAGLTRINFLTYPGLNGWFLNPLAWQFLFVLGLLVGLRLKDGARLVPVSPPLVWLAAGYVVVAMLWVKIPEVHAFLVQPLVWLSDLGAPRLLVHFDKGHLELPRLLHVLALAYLISVWPWFRQHAGAAVFAPLALLGRQALPVFALGTVLSFAARAVRELWELAGYQPAMMFDGAVLLTGLLLQLGLAAVRDYNKGQTRIAAAPAVAPQKAAVRAQDKPPSMGAAVGQVLRGRRAAHDL